MASCSLSWSRVCCWLRLANDWGGDIEPAAQGQRPGPRARSAMSTLDLFEQAGVGSRIGLTAGRNVAALAEPAAAGGRWPWSRTLLPELRDA